MVFCYMHVTWFLSICLFFWVMAADTICRGKLLFCMSWALVTAETYKWPSWLEKVAAIVLNQPNITNREWKKMIRHLYNPSKAYVGNNVEEGAKRMEEEDRALSNYCHGIQTFLPRRRNAQGRGTS